MKIGAWLRKPMAAVIAATGCFLLLVLPAGGADSGMQLDTSSAQPRKMEDLTRAALARDYGYAWRSLTDAFDSGSPGELDGYFVGAARHDLELAVASQKKNGLRSRYLSPQHEVVAVFYAPEGDVVELHDTVQCELQILDGGRIIHDQPVVLHYVVLATPAADRWLVRQFQVVPGF